MIVDDPEIAGFISKQGVHRLFVDLEVNGKHKRQGHLDTVQSVQTMDTVSRIRDGAPEGHLLVRINPFHDGTAAEVDEVIAHGADSIMLPMFHDYDTLAAFLDLLNDRIEAVPLFETVGSIAALPKIIEQLPISTLHFGLNDLSLERGDKMIFSPLAKDVLEDASQALKAKGIPFGIGGIARVSEGKIPPELLLGEHVRLGSSAAILSRSFHRQAKTLEELKGVMNFETEIAKLLRIYESFRAGTEDHLEANKIAFKEAVAAL
ncbi:MAG: aldolase [Pseudomonadota bacterium]